MSPARPDFGQVRDAGLSSPREGDLRRQADPHYQDRVGGKGVKPTVGFRHALNTVIFNLGMEMGIQFAPEVYTLVTRGEIWLRMVQNGGILVDLSGNGGTPSYVPPELGPGVVE